MVGLLIEEIIICLLYGHGNAERTENGMKKILFFPLLRMPSGHHQVADTLMSYLENRDPNIICKKVDLLSTWNPVIESIVTKTYLEWIHHSPKTYAWVYKQMAHTSKTERSYKYYEFLFIKKMQQIISDENPDLIICTHGFPSFILSRLKRQRHCNIPVINVYTDFFINDVWGKDGIDYHFVPHQTVKDDLMERMGIPEKQIFVTGIPIAEQFEPKSIIRKQKEKYRILVSGGSIGLGHISELLQQQMNAQDVEYYVLCGKNNKLYQQLINLQSNHIHPLQYIASKEEMNTLYNNVDAIITKPGGVTVSEALRKGLPIFIHSALPGQEEINLQLLMKLKLVRVVKSEESLDEQMKNFFQDQVAVEQFCNSLKQYITNVADGTPNEISRFITSLLENEEERRIWA